MTAWRIERLAKRHDRSDFDCGDDGLNDFLRRYAGQHACKDISRTYVALPQDSQAVAGYYTLSSGSVRLETLPDAAARRLPQYPIPTAHLGRLAVDVRIQGQDLGAILLVDALERARDLAERIGIHAVMVDAFNDKARSFYQAFGFLALKDDPYHLFLPMGTIRRV